MTSGTARQERSRSADRRGRGMPARQGYSLDDGVRGGRGGPGVARLAVSALPRQGVAAGCGDRAAQRGVLVGGARDAEDVEGLDRQIAAGIGTAAPRTTTRARC